MKTKHNKLVVMEGHEILKTDRSAECEELLLMKEESDKRLRLLQYINTFILTAILGISAMAAVQLTQVKDKQTIYATELIRLKTIQDINTANIGILDSRVKVLEINSMSDIKNWVDENFVRRPQISIK